MRYHKPFTLATVCVLLIAGCAETAPEPTAKSAVGEQPAPAKVSAAPTKLAVEHLPNAYRLTDKVISGGLPQEAGFAELEQLGVKTVISVDGATPDVATAKKHGLRYVHLPHGYDGIPEARIEELAKAVRDLPGPIYIHCHHGKHRSPAAAAVACVGAGLMEPATAAVVLKTAGTSDKYRGLYEAAEKAHEFDAKLLDALQVEFRETAPVPPLAHDMVEIEHLHDRLTKLQKQGWNSGAPREQAAHNSLLLREQFAELLRTEAVQREPERFKELVRESETAAKRIEDIFHEKTLTSAASAEAKTALEQVTARCASCHKEFRDKPLSEKAAPSR